MTDPLRKQLQESLGAAFILERELGGGGMSRVFIARDQTLGRDVVVKVLAPELAAGLSAERFTREIKLAAALQEPHIVPVHAAGATAEGLPWYTMPFVDGEDLRARITRGPVPPLEAASILRDVARALAYAHGRGIVHRDIKPGNVLLSSGTAVVTDFGIAKALSAARTASPDATLTQSGTSLGTPAYMAPEQASGSYVDARADLYAWGVIAYELLAGRHPFAGRTTAQQLIAAHIAETPAPLGNIARGVPASLAALVMRTLAKDPSKRPASASELVAALEGVGGVPRALSRAVVAAVAVVLLAITGGVLTWRARSAAAALPPLVAVLSFDSEGTGADSAFADGLSDAVTGKLTRLAGLRVIDRRSVFAVENDSTSPQQTGKLLGAEYVLRATVRWARGSDGASRVQVTPQLVRVRDGTMRWSGDPRVVSPGDPFAVQASIATDVAEALDIVLGSADRSRLARTPTRDTAALAAVKRGDRIPYQSTARSAMVFDQMLREFERAYRLDPQYADALGKAAQVLKVKARDGHGSPALYDSAEVLARRALGIDPGQWEAVDALGFIESVRGRPREFVRLVERAVGEQPSNADLHLEQAIVLKESGDTAGAWRALSHWVTLAPRSPKALHDAWWVALDLRGYVTASDLIARARTLEPESAVPHRFEAELAAAVGDSAAVTRAVRAFRAAGGVLRDPTLLRKGDAALAHELATASPETVDSYSANDSVDFYQEKGKLFLVRGETARARALVDSGYVIAARSASESGRLPYEMRSRASRLAWFAAARGDRAEALAALRRAGEGPQIAQYPDGIEAADHVCRSAEVHALLGDVDAMLPFANRCLTMPNGRHRSWLWDAELWRYRNEPRVRALATAFPVQLRRPE